LVTWQKKDSLNTFSPPVIGLKKFCNKLNPLSINASRYASMHGYILDDKKAALASFYISAI
jgi:hypothetical protein